MIIYFKILIIKLHVLYTINKYVKFLVNRMLLTIQFINLFFHAYIILNYKNLKFKLLIDKIAIDI